MSGASERANGRASGPVLQSVFLVDLAHCASSKGKRLLNRYFTLVCYRILSRSFSAVITYHNRQHRAQPQGICVANHTTPIDVVVLSCDNAYAMVGQKHGGFLGLMQTALHRATDHVWFERSEAHDRLAVSRWAE